MPVNSKLDRERQDKTALKNRAVEDAVEDADSYAIRVRREFENVRSPNRKDSLSTSLTQKNAGATVDSLEGIDGVLIHSVEGTTKLVLSDELLQISSVSEAESVMVEPMNLFHVQSRAPWVQLVRPGAA